MSLRDALRSAVARCMPQGVQHATSDTRHATWPATGVQLLQPLPGEASPKSATDDATAAQLIGCTAPQRTKPELQESVQAGPSLTVLDRLLRWGWAEAEAVATAARIAGQQADDDRVLCIQCHHYRPAIHRCNVHRRAALLSAEVGRELAAQPQRCPAFMQHPE